ARCVPRSAKNFLQRSRLRTRTAGVSKLDGAMDAQQALADLTEISSQIRAAVVFDEQGKVAGSTFDDAARGEQLARSSAELLAVAEGVKTGDGAELTQFEAATDEGSVFVVRQGPTRIAATTGVDPTVGLVFY